MSEIPIKREFNLDRRTFTFAKNVRVLVSSLPKSLSNNSDCIQLIRSSGSVGANYLEASESLSKKDFIMRIKISRKEAKESEFWLSLLDIQDDKLNDQRQLLIRESVELRKIFGSIVSKSSV